MRTLVAVLAASAGLACVFAGLYASRAERENGPEKAVNEFLQAFLDGDRPTMQQLLADESSADISQLPEVSLTGVKFRIASTTRDGDRSISKVTFVAPGDFLRGKVFAIHRESTWRIEGLFLDDARRDQDTESGFEELDQIPGVDVQTL